MYVCLFDIDGTLVSSGGAGKAAMDAALLSAFGVRHGTDGVPFSGRTDRSILRDLFRKNGIEETDANRERFLAEYLQHLPTTLQSHPGRVLPGIAVLLEQLQRHGQVVLGLLTGNIRHGARIKLGHFGLFEHFAFGGFGDLHHERDDVAREAFTLVERHLAAPPIADRLWVIGDTPLDVRCARAIGAQVVAVATGVHGLDELAASHPDLLMADFSDPEPLLRRLATS
ncbi:MAG: haloacid dehalogenase-like hydrolase [Planctomycetia bacterium]|nr:haloacid dehalogenase-like hydrolase [Planctomycetia bacterium]